LCQELYSAKTKFELRIESSVKPLGIAIGDTVKKSEFRRFEVTASIIVHYDHSGHSSRHRTEKVVTVKLEDWRCFGSRRFMREIRMKAADALLKLLSEKEKGLGSGSRTLRPLR